MTQPGPEQADSTSEKAIAPEAAIAQARWWNARTSKVLRATLGFGMFALAVGVVLSQRATLSESFDAIGSAHPGWVLVLLALPLANVLLTALTFKALTDRYARVPLGEMTLLMLSAGLLNYLPLRPGLVGRVAYHRQVHGIRATDSAKVVLRAMLATAFGLAGMMLAAQLVLFAGHDSAPAHAAATVLPAAACIIFGTLQTRAAPDRGMWHLLTATGWRWGDMLVWAARYAVVFELVGSPITWAEATLFAAVSQAAMVVPLFGNGLGLREWAIGAFAGRRALTNGTDSAGAITELTASGLTADLVNRAAELVVLVPLGAIAGAVLARRARAFKAAQQAASS